MSIPFDRLNKSLSLQFSAHPRPSAQSA